MTQRNGEIMEGYNTIELLEKLNENKREMSAIVRDMAQMRQDYEMAVMPLREEFNSILKESSMIGNNIVFVKLGDLLEEICWLSETNVEDLDVSLVSNISLIGEYNKEEFLKYVKDYRMNFMLSGFNTSGYSFNYITSLSMDLDSIQADAKDLKEHCSVITKKHLNGKMYTELVVDKDIENIILGINLNLLCLDTSATWRYADLFTQAVLNCEERYNQRLYKIRQRIM